MSFKAKVYVVQWASGALLAVKLTHELAHGIAKAHAPAKVTCVIADKEPGLNVPDQDRCQQTCNQLQMHLGEVFCLSRFA